jgi:hypothetical protein
MEPSLATSTGQPPMRRKTGSSAQALLPAVTAADRKMQYMADSILTAHFIIESLQIGIETTTYTAEFLSDCHASAGIVIQTRMDTIRANAIGKVSSNRTHVRISPGVKSLRLNCKGGTGAPHSGGRVLCHVCPTQITST